jgi:hypothetical protein
MLLVFNLRNAFRAWLSNRAVYDCEAIDRMVEERRRQIVSREQSLSAESNRFMMQCQELRKVNTHLFALAMKRIEKLSPYAPGGNPAIAAWCGLSVPIDKSHE